MPSRRSLTLTERLEHLSLYHAVLETDGFGNGYCIALFLEMDDAVSFSIAANEAGRSTVVYDVAGDALADTGRFHDSWDGIGSGAYKGAKPRGQAARGEERGKEAG